jgi:hypothetical protein
MLKALLRRLLKRRHVPRAAKAAPQPVRPPMIDHALEQRVLFSGAAVGPVVAQQFIGDIKHITAVVLYFDPATPLDPASASNPDAYKFVKKIRGTTIDAGDVFFGGSGSTSTKIRRIKLQSATYDPTNNSVTIKPVAPSFEIGRDFTVMVVEGTGSTPVKLADGSVIDGDVNGKPGGDVNLRFRANPNQVLNFKDADGDRAHLRVMGGGRLFYFLPKFGRSSPSIFLRDSTASTILSGTVKPGKHGDGIVNIGQITDNDDADVATISLTNPPFNVRPLATVT